MEFIPVIKNKLLVLLFIFCLGLLKDVALGATNFHGDWQIDDGGVLVTNATKDAGIYVDSSSIGIKATMNGAIASGAYGSGGFLGVHGRGFIGGSFEATAADRFSGDFEGGLGVKMTGGIKLGKYPDEYKGLAFWVNPDGTIYANNLPAYKDNNNLNIIFAGGTSVIPSKSWFPIVSNLRFSARVGGALYVFVQGKFKSNYLMCFGLREVDTTTVYPTWQDSLNRSFGSGSVIVLSHIFPITTGGDKYFEVVTYNYGDTPTVFEGNFQVRIIYFPRII